jgi:hypothetical protein
VSQVSQGQYPSRFLNADTYHLTINGEMWSVVEWSASRRAWCVQDAAGQCLAHVEHIIGQDRDVQTAIRLAKRMIVDGRMPAPEEAHRQLKEERERDRLGEPWESLPEPVTAEQEAIPLVARLETKSLKW